MANADLPLRVNFPDYFLKSGGMNVVANNEGGLTMYEAKRPVKSVASDTQQELTRAKTENYKLKIVARELEKKIAKWSFNEEGGQEQEINKDYNNDKVIRNLYTLIKKIEKELVTLNETQNTVKANLKIINAEIESYNKQLIDLENREKDILKSNMGGGGADGRKEKKEL